MFTFQTTDRYIKNGKIDDYKNQFGRIVGELTVAHLKTNEITITMSVSQSNININILNMPWEHIQIKTRLHGTPSPQTIEELLFHTLKRDVDYQSNNMNIHLIKSCNMNLIYSESTMKKKLEQLHLDLLNLISDEFPFNFKCELDKERETVTLYIYHSSSSPDDFKSIVEKKIQDTLSQFNKRPYFDR